MQHLIVKRLFLSLQIAFWSLNDVFIFVTRLNSRRICSWRQVISLARLEVPVLKMAKRLSLHLFLGNLLLDVFDDLGNILFPLAHEIFPSHVSKMCNLPEDLVLNSLVDQHLHLAPHWLGKVLELLVECGALEAAVTRSPQFLKLAWAHL